MTAVNFREERERSLPVAFTLALLANVLLVFIPLPIGPMRRRLIGYSRKRKAGRDTVFFCHPDIVCTAHLIWVGWVVAAAGAYNVITAGQDWWVVPMQPLYWLWVATLLLTIIVLGLRFNVVACGFLAAGALTAVTAALLLQQRVESELLGEFYAAIEAVPVEIAWGVPLIVSLVLGCVFATVTAWQTVNEVWVLPYDEDYIEQHQFLRRSWSRSLGALNFEATTPCLIRHCLFFGYGNVIIRLSIGTELAMVEGVFFARRHAELMRRRVASIRAEQSQDSSATQTAIQDAAVDTNDAADAASELEVA